MKIVAVLFCFAVLRVQATSRRLQPNFQRKWSQDVVKKIKLMHRCKECEGTSCSSPQQGQTGKHTQLRALAACLMTCGPGFAFADSVVSAKPPTLRPITYKKCCHGTPVMLPSSVPPPLQQILARAVQTTVGWGIPAVLVMSTAAVVGNVLKDILKEISSLETSFSSSSAATSPRLVISRLNDQLRTWDYKMFSATVSEHEADQRYNQSLFEQRFGADFVSFNLTPEKVEMITEAEKKYRERDSELRGKIAGQLNDLRKYAMKQKGNKLKGFLGIKALRRRRNRKRISKLQDQRFKNEIKFLASLSDTLDSKDAERLAEHFKSYVPLDAVSAFAEMVDTTKAVVKHVWVLRFFGDVYASQVNSLRNEVTALVRSANVSRGDEVVLVLESGGGTVVGYGSAAAQLKRIKDAGLRLTVCIEEVAASGGYDMACVGDRILATRDAAVGSIGTVASIPNFYERLHREGVAYTEITAGKYKRTLGPFKKITEEDVEKEKQEVEQVNELFKNWVTRNRPQLDIDDVATGEVWYGKDAVDKKLIDGIMSVDEILAEHIANGSEVFSVTYRRPAPRKSLLKQVLGMRSSQGRGPNLPAWLLDRALGPLGHAITENTITSEKDISDNDPWSFSTTSLAMEDSRTNYFERRLMKKLPDRDMMLSQRYKQSSDSQV